MTRISSINRTCSEGPNTSYRPAGPLREGEVKSALVQALGDVLHVENDLQEASITRAVLASRLRVIICCAGHTLRDRAKVLGMRKYIKVVKTQISRLSFALHIAETKRDHIISKASSLRAEREANHASAKYERGVEGNTSNKVFWDLFSAMLNSTDKRKEALVEEQRAAHAVTAAFFRPPQIGIR